MKILAVNAFDQFGCQKSFDKVLPTYFWKRFSCFSFPEKRKTKRKRVFQFVLSKIVPFSVSLFDLFFSCYFFIFSTFATFSPWKNFIFFLKTSCFCFFKNLSLFSSLFTYFFPNFFQLFFPTSAWFQGTCFRASSADGRSVASKANIFAQSSASKCVKYAKSVAICFFIQKI